MPSTADPAADAVLRAAVGYGLEHGAAWPTDPMAPETFRRVFSASQHHRLLGTLVEAVEDAALVVTVEQRAELADHHARAQAHVLELERTLVLAADAFVDADIDFRVLKGIALAHRVYGDPSWRVASDVDVLVRSDRLDAAVAIATSTLGGVQPVAELRPGFDQEFGKESMVQIGAVELDLHRTLVTGPFGLNIALDDLFAGPATIRVGTHEVRTLGNDLQFLHACYNAALGDYPIRLGSIRDLLLCRSRLEPDFDAVVELATRWRGRAVVQKAARLAIDIAGPGFATELGRLDSLPVPAKERWLLRSYHTPGRSYWRPLASLAVIPGVGARVRYARALLAPSGAYLHSRGWSKRTHVRRAIRRLGRRDRRG